MARDRAIAHAACRFRWWNRRRTVRILTTVLAQWRRLPIERRRSSALVGAGVHSDYVRNDNPFASLSGFAAWLVVSRLPTLDDPILEVEGFSAAIDRFWLAVADADPQFERQRCAQQLRDAGALRIVLMPGAAE